MDYVVHSATKYLGGHNDLLAGVVLGSNEAIEPVRKLRTVMGGTIGAHTVYLLSRGLKTLEVRVQRQNANAQAVAEFLHNHPRVDRAYYPGLRDHPTHAIAKQQMRGFGGLLMFSVKDADWKRASAVLDHLKLFRIAASLGGCESLAEQPKVFSHFSKTPEQLAAIGFKENMIRISCGIENAEDLIADLDQALKRSA
ncbi:MAG: PLP-dependent transferase [Planctomycetota bacterium]